MCRLRASRAGRSYSWIPQLYTCSTGTTLVRDIKDAGVNLQSANAGGMLFFGLRKAWPGSGFELWRTDGTRSGTRLVRDIRPGTGPSWPYELTTVAGTPFFRANDGIHGRDPWYQPWYQTERNSGHLRAPETA